MRKKFRLLPLVIAVSMIITLFAACGKDKETKTDNTTAAGTTQAEKLPKVTLKMFMSSYGVLVPDDVKPGDNKYINIVKEKFNVDLVVDMPAWQDFPTKLNLLLASADLPDIVMSNDNTKIDEYGKKGAFIDLKSKITGSPILSKLYDQGTLQIATCDNGIVYRIPQVRARQVGQNSAIARVDLLNEINNGVIPKTPDEWFEVMNKLKQKYPDSVPFTCRSNFVQGTVFFEAYGAVPNYNAVPAYSIQSGDKVVCNFELPQFKEACKFYKKLYDNGLMDKEFATNDAAKQSLHLQTHKSIIWNNAPDSILGTLSTIYKVDPKVDLQYVEHPVAPGIDPVTAINFKQPKVNQNSVSITSSSKNQDRAFQMLEYMGSDEWRDICFWGLEGEGYTVENGKKVLNAKNYQAEVYRKIYTFIVGGDAIPEVVNASYKDQVGQQAFDKTYNSIINVANAEGAKRGMYPFEFKPFTKGTDEKSQEAWNYIMAAASKYVTGAISETQYDKLVSDYKGLYGAMTDSAQKWWTESKSTIAPILK